MPHATTAFPSRLLSLLVLLLLCAGTVRAQTITTYASGLLSPVGILPDASGNLWISEQGTGSDDGRVSVVVPDGTVYPFIEGLPSIMVVELSGPSHAAWDVNGDLLLLLGEGTDPLSGGLYRIDPTGFVPGVSSPFGPGDLTLITDISTFILGEGFAESNPFDLTLGPDDDFFVNDAAANATLRIDRDTGVPSVFATYPDVPNPLFPGFGPPVTNFVPTGLLFMGDHFLVGSLPGFPFAEGTAQVVRLNLDGTTEPYVGGLTTVTDLAVDPRDGRIAISRIYNFSPPPPPVGPQPFTGGVFKSVNDHVQMMVDGLNFSSALAFMDNGTLFVSTLLDGEILRIETDVYEANLAGYNEKHPSMFGSEADGFFPNTVATTGTGSMTAILDGDDLILSGSFSGLEGDYTASHIHGAKAGVNGGVVIPLSPAVDGGLREGTFDEVVTDVSAEVIAALLAGELYVNIHSSDFPPGEIRGQLLQAPNLPPEPVTDVIPLSPLTFVNEGDPTARAFDIAWSPVTDPNGDRVIYVVDTALDPDFTMPLLSPMTVLEGEVITSFGSSVGVIDAIFDLLSIPVGGTLTVHARVNSGDGSLRTLGEPFEITATRGIVSPDVAAPECEIISILPGPPTQLIVQAQDTDTGIASIEILRDKNADIVIDAFNAGTTDPVQVTATKINQGRRASILLEVTDMAGNSVRCDPILTTVAGEKPDVFDLEQNYPNPFNPSTRIAFQLPEATSVRLRVYDVTGRLMATLVDQVVEAGTHEAEWNGRTAAGYMVPSGVYFYRIDAGTYTATRRMLLVK